MVLKNTNLEVNCKLLELATHAQWLIFFQATKQQWSSKRNMGETKKKKKKELNSNIRKRIYNQDIAMSNISLKYS